MLGHSKPRIYVTSDELIWKYIHCKCNSMEISSSSKNADLSGATECSVPAQLGQKRKCTQITKKNAYQNKKAKIQIK